MCGIQATQLRPVAEMERCSQCRWKREHKCLVKGCKTPDSKVKLRSIPGRLVQATDAVRGEILTQFGISPELTQCCKSCGFIKLHRATTEFATALAKNSQHEANSKTTEFATALAKNSQQNSQHEANSKRGRSTAHYENASTKTKKRIEKKAMELLHDNLSSLKESYDEFSGGCGETLLDITMQAANVNTPRVQKTNEVKLAKN